ncbi:hypothetical protein [Halorubrum salsamenti]|uniref:hypothetical protein n=1 Tax=Halorubrum salsamenti TaxID=2583990 RepID=UPI00119E61A6|nr:hypothetical protein [Halorubrum salsamenti]
MAAEISRWSRRYVLVGVLALCCWQVATVAGLPRRTTVTLGVFGFVFQIVFGKAYALVPAYFDVDLVFEHAPMIQFPFVVTGAACLALDPLLVRRFRVDLGVLGGVLWTVGVVVFIGALALTIGGPLRHGTTGTGEHNADRRPLDRFANRFVPIVLLYLLVGSYETVAGQASALPPLIGVRAAATHLLAAGAATLLVVTLGFRLLPRFLGARPTRSSAALVLPVTATAPGIIAGGFVDDRWLPLGAALMVIAMVGFALVVSGMWFQSDKRRIGLYALLPSATFGVIGVLFGGLFAVGGASPALIETHLRVNLLGFLGLMIVGTSFQFYPPRLGAFPGSSNRSASVAIAALACGLGIEVLGVAAIAVFDPATASLSTRASAFGRWLTLFGAFGYAYLIASVFRTRAT